MSPDPYGSYSSMGVLENTASSRSNARVAFPCWPTGEHLEAQTPHSYISINDLYPLSDHFLVNNRHTTTVGSLYRTEILGSQKKGLKVTTEEKVLNGMKKKRKARTACMEKGNLTPVIEVIED
jgi:hypothetical protein